MITISPQLHDAANNVGFDAATLSLALQRIDGAQNFPFLDPGTGSTLPGTAATSAAGQSTILVHELRRFDIVSSYVTDCSLTL